MAGFEDLVNPEYGKLIGTDYKFVDADTIKDPEGNNLRLIGVNAPETGKSSDDFAQEVGGVMTQEQVMKLANDLGFTNVVRTTDPTGQETDKFGRGFADLLDADGRSFSRSLAQQGITDIHHKYDPGNVLLKSREFQDAVKTGGEYQETEWDAAANMIAQAVKEEQRYGNQFKQAQDFSGQVGHLDQLIKDAEAEGDTVSANLLRTRRNQFNTFADASLKLSDRDQVTGHSNNPFGTAWDTGWLGIAQSGYGIANLLGEKTGNEWLSEYGEAGNYGIEQTIAGKGKILLDYKDVDGFWSAIEYVTNNAAISVPYMAATIGSAALAPATGGASLAIPASIYTGQTWNEMEGDKSASIAIGSGVAQAALDRIGLGYIVKSGVAPKKLFNDAVDELVKKGMTKEAAKQTVSQATRKEIAGFAGAAADVARKQIAAKEVFKNFASKAAVGAGGESITEGLQEATAYLGATLGSDKQFDFEELTERMIAGAVAGASLGGTFATPGAAFDTAAWADISFRQLPADERRLSQSGRYAEEEIAREGRVKSVQELAAETKARVDKSQPSVTLEERVVADKARRKSRTTSEAITETALKAPALWRGATRFIFNPALQARSRSARVLADMFGGNLQRVFSGSTFENAKHHKVSIYKNMLELPDNVYAELTGGKRLTRTQKGEVSDKVYSKLQAAIDKDGNFDPNAIPDTDAHKPILLKVAKQLQELSDRMYQDQAKHNPDLGYIQNYLLRYKSLSKKAINKDRHGFQKLLREEYGYSETEAKELVDNILDNAEVNDIEEAFSVTKGGIVPGSHRKRSLNLSENEKFNQFLERDLFANVSNAAKSAARYTAHREFIGQNGEIIAKLLDDMQAEGVPSSEVDKIAHQIQQYLDAESGNYKRPTSDAGKAALRLQKNFMMLTTLAGLPLATISSFVEFALSARGLTISQIFGGKGSLANAGKEFAQTMWDGANEITNVATRKAPQKYDGTAGQERIRDLGYYDWDVGAATTTGVSETNPLQQNIYEQFFKWTGLQGWTNYTRAVRASISGDYILDKLETIHEQRSTGEVKNNEVQEAEEALRNLGLNVDDVINAMYNSAGQFTPEQEAILEQNMREASFNFVNDAVALPQAANRPLIYQDPRFALFTQFQGFIATFTANHIPKLWGEYVKRGSPAMKYNAFALMSTMIMLGFASQYLKDLIKYGGQSPYLNDAEYLQRGIRSSGLLGTGERVLDQFFPLYEQRSGNPGEWVWNTTSGESPALSNLKRVGRGTGQLLSGDVGSAAKQFAKSTPGIGPFNLITEGLGNAASNWNFRGGS